jgi:hypothetical protein
MGISYETFWHLNPKKMKPIEKAYEMKMESQQAQMNLEAWLDGLYVQNAVASVLAKNAKYPKKPFELFGAEKKKTPEEEAEEFKRYVEDMAIKRKAIKAMG